MEGANFAKDNFCFLILKKPFKYHMHISQVAKLLQNQYLVQLTNGYLMVSDSEVLIGNVLARHSKLFLPV